MKKGINTFIKVYMEILYALSSVFYAGFCLCVLVQVISRNFLPNAPSWTEELARYSFIYMVAFGVGLAALKHEFVNVEFMGDFLNKKNPKALKILNLVIEFAILAMCLVVLIMAEPKYCFPSFSMNSTAANIPMKYIYFSQFLTFTILPVSYLLDILRTALSWNDTPAEKED